MTIFTKTYKEPPICEKEILRYAGCKEASDDVTELMHSCIDEARLCLSYKVCYCELSVKVEEDECDFGNFSVASGDLVKCLAGSNRVVLFGATVGSSLDRLIAKYSRISPSRALMLQAIGAERIEALCDAFCKESGCGVRFSPGYGDLSLQVQKKIFDILNCEKHIGLTLNDSLVMSPSKSVTAFAVSGKAKNKCKSCKKTDCAYRGAL
ncbi:MAG: Vitamin B12 dependent methionine synthase activation subunit [Clostridia bacterium]|nr:Vitamin B12 dependent methionine synthase activation subunit [Clostridia bacterium]